MAESSQTAHTVALRPNSISEAGSRSREFNVAAHGLRGVASVMVLGAHIFGGTAKHVYQSNEAYTQLVLHPWYVGVFGVKLFFVISGFVILPSVLKYSAYEFTLRRFFRIYPLFFFFTLLFVVLNAFTNAYPGTNNLESIISGLLFINLFTGTEQLTPNAWSLSFEVMFYALTCWSVYALVKRPSLSGALLSSSAAVIFLWIFPITFFFIAGLVVRLLYGRLSLPAAVLRGLEALCLVGLIFAAGAKYFDYYSWSDLRDPVAISALLFTAAYFYLAIDSRSITSYLMQNRVALYFGTISYSIYLVHPYTYYGLRALFVRMGWFTEHIGQSMLLFSIATIILSIFVSHYVHIALERLPYQWFFRQRIYRSRPAEQLPS